MARRAGVGCVAGRAQRACGRTTGGRPPAKTQCSYKWGRRRLTGLLTALMLSALQLASAGRGVLGSDTPGTPQPEAAQALDTPLFNYGDYAKLLSKLVVLQSDGTHASALNNLGRLANLTRALILQQQKYFGPATKPSLNSLQGIVAATAAGAGPDAFLPLIAQGLNLTSPTLGLGPLLSVTPVFINYVRGLFVGTEAINLVAPILFNSQVGAFKVDVDAGAAFCPRFFEIQPTLFQFKGVLTNINAPSQSLIDIQPSLIDFKGAVVTGTARQPCPGGPSVTQTLIHRNSGSGDVIIIPDGQPPLDVGPVDTSTGSVTTALPNAGDIG